MMMNLIWNIFIIIIQNRKLMNRNRTWIIDIFILTTEDYLIRWSHSNLFWFLFFYHVLIFHKKWIALKKFRMKFIDFLNFLRKKKNDHTNQIIMNDRPNLFIMKKSICSSIVNNMFFFRRLIHDWNTQNRINMYEF